MSAPPRVDTAPGRLRLWRVAFARLAHIREGHVLRLGDEESPLAESAESPDAIKVSFQLPYVAGLQAMVPIEPKKAERYEHETPEFHKIANMLHKSGEDPEEILRGVLQNIFKKKGKVGPRFSAIIEAECERRRVGTKARGAANEKHRKRLDRALALLFPDKKIRKSVMDLYLNPPLDIGPPVQRGQENLSHKNDLTKSDAPRFHFYGETKRREGDAEHGTAQEHGGGQRARAPQGANAPKLPEQRRRPGLHQAGPEPRGVPDGGSRAVDRVPAPQLDVRPRPRRPRRVRCDEPLKAKGAACDGAQRTRKTRRREV